MYTNKENIRNHIRKQYSKAANKQAKGCCGSGCGCNQSAADISEVSKKLGYTDKDFFDAPFDSNMALGCGNPVAIALLKEGEFVLDLGSGGGFDCFLARKQVGEKGFVIGVDMTPDMITLARSNLEKSGYNNMEFRLGEIEYLPVADNFIDVIISNCVINLSLDKPKVFKEAYRVLKSGGRLSISDVLATAEIPEKIKKDLNMVSACIGGAEYIDSVNIMLQEVGFIKIKLTQKDNSAKIIKEWAPGSKIENCIASYIIEAVKP